MRSFLAPFEEWTYAAMRIVLAFLYLCHGLQKVFGLLGGHQVPLTSAFGAAGIIETVLGPLIAIGLCTPYAAFVASGEMASAYFMAHFPRGFLPVQNGGDIVVALCFAFLYIAARGGGRLSADTALFG